MDTTGNAIAIILLCLISAFLGCMINSDNWRETAMTGERFVVKDKVFSCREVKP